MIFPETFGLFTDFYELLMAQGYYLAGRHSEPSAFDYSFRDNPFNGGYVVFAGLQDLLAFLQELRFDTDAINYLRQHGFRDEFLRFLSDFRFCGTIRACREGETVFPREPIVRVEGELLETQIIETLLLNILNFESLIATKASRIRQAAGGRIISEFGLRRAQGLAGIHGSRAAIIGGLDSTSNVLSAHLFGLNPSGTQAHSWIQSFDDELESFRAYARAFPDRCILLVDTYDTLNSGIPHAITVAKEMESRGERLAGIRLDSGDLAYLSKRARSMLDAASLTYVKIVASNRLDEHIIKSLIDQDAPIDIFGVGTALITGHPDAALDGVYKLAMSDGKPRMKRSELSEKMSLPGMKKILRAVDGSGSFLADGVALDDETGLDEIRHAARPELKSNVGAFQQEALYETVMEKGEVRVRSRTTEEIAAFARERLAKLPEEHKRFINPHIYRVGITPRLLALRSSLLGQSREPGANTLEH